jgi:Transcriptional regulator
MDFLFSPCSDRQTAIMLQRQGVAKQADNLAQAHSSDHAELKIAKRRRPGDSQREQKEQTRKKLLEAAQVVFKHHSYSETAVEMVADQAGVSRTTFYRHFDGKLPLALALFDDIAPRIKNTWSQLFQIRNPTPTQVGEWLTQLIKESSLNQVLVSVFIQIDATEPDAQANKYRYYDDIWNLSGLGKGFDEIHREEIRAKFILTMLQIDQFLYLVCMRGYPNGDEILRNAMAEIIHNFLVEARTPGKAKRKQLAGDVPT